MKTNGLLSFALTFVMCSIAMAQYDPYNPSNPYPNSDFSAISPSYHILYYNIIDSVMHEVKVSGVSGNFNIPIYDGTDTVYMSCGTFVVVPSSVQHNGITYTVTSVGKNWVLGGRACGEVYVQLPTTILSLEDSAFTGNCIPILHSAQPPTIEATSIIGCEYICVPCGCDSVYQNALGSYLNGTWIAEVRNINVSYLHNFQGEVSFNIGCWYDTSHVGLFAHSTDNLYLTFAICLNIPNVGIFAKKTDICKSLSRYHQKSE